MLVTLTHGFRFEAAHALPKLPEDHKCRRLHGHGYKIEFSVRGAVDPVLGWFVDFAELAQAARAVQDTLDHRVLNDVPGLENPTAELLAVWVWEQLKPELHGLTEVVVHETCTSRCAYHGD